MNLLMCENVENSLGYLKEDSRVQPLQVGGVDDVVPAPAL